MAYQAEFCYSAGFASCSVFLAWAARNAAEPAYVTDAARAAWASGVAAPEGPSSSDPSAANPFAWGSAGSPEHDDPDAAEDADAWPGAALQPIPAAELFAPTEFESVAGPATKDAQDWVSASAWAAAPWDPDAEAEAEELEALAGEVVQPAIDEGELAAPTNEEALQGPKVPAALPLRRRARSQAPIRARGSGEWLYADPLERQPLVRRGGIGAPIMLGVLGLLVISILVVLVPTLVGGGPSGPAALTSASPGASMRPATTPAPQRTLEASPSPSVAPEPETRVYTVRPGNTLSAIASRFDVSQRHLQCLNVITNPNLLQPGQRLLIPPEGFSCPSGWRDMTPPPIP